MFICGQHVHLELPCNPLPLAFNNVSPEKPPVECGRLPHDEIPVMKRVFTSPDSAEVGLLKNMLLKAGIRCAETNEQMAQMIPTAEFQAELWVENEADYPLAAALLEQWQHPTAADGADWACPRCGEKMGSQFSKCWKCGTKRDNAAA